jgi:hypothetical protein
MIRKSQSAAPKALFLISSFCKLLSLCSLTVCGNMFPKLLMLWLRQDVAVGGQDAAVGGSGFCVVPKTDVVINFKYHDLKTAPRWTSVASLFPETALNLGKVLERVWRVGLSREDAEVSPKRPLYFTVGALRVNKDSVLRLL